MKRGYYELLLRCFPSAFRQRYGEDLRSEFESIRSEIAARGGRWRLLLFYGRLTVDTLRQALVEHRRPPWRAVSESTRRFRPVAGLFQNIRFTLKGFRRQPAFVLLAVATLGIAIGANTTIFSVANGLLLRRLPYDDASRLVLVFNHYPTLDITRGRQSPGDFTDYREQANVFEVLSAVGAFHQQTLTGLGETTRIDTSSAFPEFFPLLGVEPVLGRHFSAGDDPFKVLLGYGFWQSRFGGRRDVLGASFELNGNPVEVIGVLPPDFLLHLPAHAGIPTQVDVWMGMRYLGTPENPDRTAHWMTTIGRLKPGVTLAHAQAEMDLIAAWQRTHVPKRQERQAEIAVVPMHDEIVREVEPTLTALLLAVGCVLLIGCANVANLLLARGQTRRREIAIRTALGGSRGQIARLLITESAVLASLAALAGVLLATLLLEAVKASLPASVPLVDQIAIDWSVLAFATLLAAGAVLVFGIAPAVVTMRRAQAGALSTGGGSGGLTARSTKRFLIVAEVAISVTLLVGGGLMLRTVDALSRVETGYETGHLLTFVVQEPDPVFSQPDETEARQQFLRLAEETVAALPGVVSVGTIWPPPLGGSGQGASTYSASDDPSEQEAQLASSQLITPAYFETMGIPLLEGRAFNWGDRGDKLIIDGKMARKMWPDTTPLGKRLKIGWWSGPKWGEVVGVVPNLRTHSLFEDDPETVYRVAAVYGYSPQTFVLRTAGDPMSVAQSARQALLALHPTVTVDDIRPLQANLDRQMAPTRFVMVLIGVFAAIGLSFSVVGLYGVISYLVSQRTREMGIRLAFGARAGQLLTLVVRQGMSWVLAGVVLGIAGSFAAGRFLSSLLFGVEPGDPLTLGVVVAVLFAAALPACLLPARRATRVDPVASLRGD